MYKNIIRLWLTAILLFLPFQDAIYRISFFYQIELGKYINRIDEITVIIFTPLALIEIYRKREFINRPFLLLLFSILSLSLHGLVSGLINNNSLASTIHGTFDYIKYLVVFFIYAAFFHEPDDVKKIFKSLVAIAVFFGIVAFIQEAWAIGNKYILKKAYEDIFYLEIDQIFNIKQNVNDTVPTWRFGMVRTPALMANHNMLGSYCLFILTIYFCFKRKTNPFILSTLLFGIVGSISRTVYTSFLFMIGLQIFRGRKWLLLFLIPAILAILTFSSKYSFNILNVMESVEAYTSNSEEASGTPTGMITYRRHMRDKAIEIWKDHVIWGVGPAMYGGLAVKYNSPVLEYDRYRIAPIAVYYLKAWGTIDQFWPQVLAELGVIGILIFVWFFISLAVLLFLFRKRAPSDEMKNLFEGFMIFYVVMLISTFANTLNFTPVIFPYYALIGIASGYIGRLSSVR